LKGLRPEWEVSAELGNVLREMFDEAGETRSVTASLFD